MTDMGYDNFTEVSPSVKVKVKVKRRPIEKWSDNTLPHFFTIIIFSKERNLPSLDLEGQNRKQFFLSIKVNKIKTTKWKIYFG